MRIDELYLEVDKTLFGVLRPEKTDGAEYICADCSLGARRVRLRLKLRPGGFADLAARIRAMAAQAKGYKWHPYGCGFQQLPCGSYSIIHTIRSEQEVFDFVGLPYLMPWERK